MAEYTLTPTQSESIRTVSEVREEDDEICGAEMTDGSTCERDPEECQYH